MYVARVSLRGVLVLGLALLWAPAARAAHTTVYPGDSIQAAVDAASPGDTIKVMPGDYMETHGNSAAVRVTKPLKLIARSKPLGAFPDAIVRIIPGPGNTSGIVVEPANPGDPDIDGLKIKGFTVEGFHNNGIWLKHVRNFKIQNNTTIDNLENGIWPTLSANGLVKKNVSYGSEDSALWIEASENVRAIKNELYNSPTGFEITVSKNITAKRNDIHDNSTGMGLYHPSAAGLPPLGGDGDWDVISNHVYDNNFPNNAPGGSMSAGLPQGGGVLVLGADRVHLLKNQIENNDFYGISVIDYCVAVDGTDFDCDSNPPEVEPAPDDNTFVANTLVNNGTNPNAEMNPDFDLFALFAADITYLVTGGGHVNCFANNTYATLSAPADQPVLANSCN